MVHTNGDIGPKTDVSSNSQLMWRFNLAGTCAIRWDIAVAFSSCRAVRLYSLERLLLILYQRPMRKLNVARSPKRMQKVAMPSGHKTAYLATRGPQTSSNIYKLPKLLLGFPRDACRRQRQSSPSDQGPRACADTRWIWSLGTKPSFKPTREHSLGFLEIS